MSGGKIFLQFSFTKRTIIFKLESMNSLQRLSLVFYLQIVIATCLVAQSTYYVSPTGSDTYPGTIDSAFQTIPKAVSVAIAGDTIYLRGGTYNIAAKISINKSGLAGLHIKLWAYPGEKPVIDFSAIGGTSIDGFSLNQSYWHFKGLEIKKAPHNGIKISNGDNNIIENCSFHDCGNTGFQLGSSSAISLSKQ